jgi:TolA-binding protein
MDDPRRLIDDSASPIGRALLASAQRDTPSSGSRARVARRLGVVAVLAAGASAGSEAGAIAATWKLAAVVVALGGVVGLAIWRSPDPPAAVRPVAVAVHAAPRAPRGTGDAQRPAPAPSAAPSAPDPAAPVASAAPAAVAPPAHPVRTQPTAPPTRVARGSTGPVVVAVPEVAAAPDVTAPDVGAAPVPAPPSGPIASQPVLPPTSEPAPITEPAPAAAARETVIMGPGGPGGPGGPSRLAAEVALVDRARARLSAGDVTAALAAIEEYHRRFPGGDLEAEADVVTIEAVIAQRNVARARSLAAAFLSRFPRSPHAQRVRSLLDSLPK